MNGYGLSNRPLAGIKFPGVAKAMAEQWGGNG